MRARGWRGRTKNSGPVVTATTTTRRVSVASLVKTSAKAVAQPAVAAAATIGFGRRRSARSTRTAATAAHSAAAPPASRIHVSIEVTFATVVNGCDAFRLHHGPMR